MSRKTWELTSFEVLQMLIMSVAFGYTLAVGCDRRWVAPTPESDGNSESLTETLPAEESE